MELRGVARRIAAGGDRRYAVPEESMFAKTPKPPYYAVIFTSTRAGDEGYAETSERMNELASEQPGFLGIESVRGDDGLGITVSYWTDLESIRAWKANAEHRIAQQRGKREWYSDYVTRVCRVEYDYTRH
jgi:heme-degrading monooxygenase HmoA